MQYERKLLVLKMPGKQKKELIRHIAGKHHTQFGVYWVLNLSGKYIFSAPASHLMAFNLAAYTPL
jgi:hypothetical protein